MANYKLYPAVDENFNFAPPVRQAFANSPEFAEATTNAMASSPELKTATGEILDEIVQEPTHPTRQKLETLFGNAVIDGGTP